MQERRHLRDDLESHEHRQHEDVQCDEQGLRHDAPPSTTARTRTDTIFPSCVTHASRMISSSTLRVCFPSLIRSWRYAAWFRDSIRLACTGIDDTSSCGAWIVTPYSTTVSPARHSSQFPPCSPAR